MAADYSSQQVLRHQEEQFTEPYSDRPEVQLSKSHREMAEPAPGETAEQHAAHAIYQSKKHWGLDRRSGTILFYAIAIPSWVFEIVASALAPYYKTHSAPFIACATIWLFLWAFAWLQTASAMLQRASWVRDESNLKDRRQFLDLSVRLNQLMMPTALIAFVTFLVAYTGRRHYHDLTFWLLFLLLFILNTVGCVMNAYNNIGWECDRLHYEEGEAPMKYTRLAMLGIPS
ncbi:uncharacterized protein K489DRAFT_384897 [Dissoconium aciculare CBS 342.82]|jgi:hypothetical protein|uniref:Uncharacterized protein n=1 Tax=Dissoconium aciculare CBS 342.82 TaxID=1314786 RepID=A0A6J3LT59_9PEZI|nr:uncharacterized protein K489DRAFT_384897 [Dissoconium aciculare CBS 342.82]KAF1818469.1 hypothetical protein K489DRAFT_384897 [Dissoconium aciculare CBS 342.82]